VPDAEGGLSTEEEAKVSAWLEENWTNSDCPFHGPTRWKIGGVVHAVPLAHGHLVTFNVGIYPLINVTCLTCGYTAFINALLCGIVSPDEEKASN
jgi:hypothetical protein